MSSAAAVLDPPREAGRPRPWLANRSEQAVKDSHPTPGTICISITDPHRPAAEIMPRLYGYEAVLRMRFCDADPGDEVRARLLRLKCGNCGREGGHAMTPAEAQMIADFACRHRGLSIMVHCAAGISRSAAIVQVLLEAFPEYEDRMWPGKPNGHILSLMRRAFGLPLLIEGNPLEDDE